MLRREEQCLLGERLRAFVRPYFRCVNICKSTIYLCTYLHISLQASAFAGF